jgi:competence protein ComEA
MAGWAQDRLPATLQGRVRMAPRHLGVLGLLVLAALGLTGWWFAHAGVGAGTEVSPVVSVPASSPSALVPPAAPGSTPATAVSASASPTGELVVDVTGKVHHPGIVTLPLGARVVDAVHAAGGARRGASLAGLNLARPLSDGEQVVVGVPAVPGVAAPAASAATASGGTGARTPMVDVNSAGQPQLEELPGVGPVTAQAILAYREENGPFTSVDQLLDVSGIGDATLAKIAPFVTL